MELKQLAERISFQSVVSFIAGATSVLAFEPYGWWPIIFISLLLLFYFWFNASPLQAFVAGFCFGFGLFSFGVSWVYISLSTYGGMPLWMGIISVVLFAGVLALFFAMPGTLLATLFIKGSCNRLLAMPATLVLFEWLKSWIFTGFPWLELGYTQTSSWLFSLAPIGGIYLISFCVASLSILLLAAFVNKQKLILIGFVLIWSMAWQFQNIEWTQPTEQSIKVGVVQGNVDIEKKWLAHERNQVIQKYVRMSQKIADDFSADLIVWPETALPLYLQQTDPQFWSAITPNNTALLTGLVDSPTREQTYNSAVLSCNENQHVYRKRHLVPFGEYLPLRFLFNWVLEYLQLPMSDFSSWQGQQTLSCGEKINLSLSICYEDAFGSEWRRYLNEATLLVNISEDAWFGDSLAPHQRMQMAQMRAREFSRPLVRSANTGPSVIIDHLGQIMVRTTQFEANTAYSEVQPQTGDTLYRVYGNWIILLSIGLLILLGVRDSKHDK